MWNRPWGSTGYIQDPNGTRTNFFDRSAADVVAAAPDIIIVQGGINDLNRGYTSAAFRTAVEQLYEHTHSLYEIYHRPLDLAQPSLLEDSARKTRFGK